MSTLTLVQVSKVFTANSVKLGIHATTQPKQFFSTLIFTIIDILNRGTKVYGTIGPPEYKSECERVLVTLMPAYDFLLKTNCNFEIVFETPDQAFYQVGPVKLHLQDTGNVLATWHDHQNLIILFDCNMIQKVIHDVVNFELTIFGPQNL